MELLYFYNPVNLLLPFVPQISILTSLNNNQYHVDYSFSNKPG